MKRQVIANTFAYHTRLYRLAIEIYKLKNYFNKEEEEVKINKTEIPGLETLKIMLTNPVNKPSTRVWFRLPPPLLPIDI